MTRAAQSKSRTRSSDGDLFIVDNSDREWNVRRYLHDWCKYSQTIDVATGHFEIGSLLCLEDAWQAVDHLRILMGDEVSRRTKRAFEDALRSLLERLDDSIEREKEKNDFLAGVPEAVWNFHIGGYQVCHKWLSDRKKKGGKNPRPGRVLTDDDIAHYHRIIIALNETIRLMKEIDEVIEAHGGWPDAFVTDRPIEDPEA